MNWKSPNLWIACASASVVGFLAVVDLGQGTAPGELATVHSRVDELSGRGSCSECHGGFMSSMTGSCLECHQAIEEHLDGGLGLHGTLAEELTDRCALCHSEHHGPGFSIVNRQSFRVAGVPDPLQFEHERVGFDMQGRHEELDCAQCHEHADERVLPAGAHRFLGLDSTCTSCHEDPHEGRMALACVDCHDQASFETHHLDGHDEHLPLAGGHGDLSCRACHAQDGERALETLGHGRKLSARECTDCHESPHTGLFVERSAALFATSRETSCVECHEPEHALFREPGLALTPEEHASSGFSLGAPHDAVACAGCHEPELASFRLRYPGRRADDCAQCHDDPHGGQFVERGETRCVDCHASDAFEPHAFGLEQHARTNLPLTASHADAECDACHVVLREGDAKSFRGTPHECAQCHSDAHAGFFERFAERAGPTPEHGECARCHRPSSFADVPAQRFDHGLWTDFPIAGAHTQAACERCHGRTETADQHGRAFGRIADRFGEFEGCATCHGDPHEGAFAEPREVGGHTGCLRCHVEDSFRAFPQPFDHALWTGFPLAGAHAATSCASCHETLVSPDSAGRTWGRARGARCADCHADPHAGQFRGEDERLADCSRCHDDAAGFAELVFDHDRDSRFPLEDGHEALACGACHRAWGSGERRVVRYRPLGTRCDDCHGGAHDPLQRRQKKGGKR